MATPVGSIRVSDARGDELWFRCTYGAPADVLPMLEQFLVWVESGVLRDNVEQSAGWLVVLGAYSLENLLRAAGLPRRADLFWPNDEQSEHGWKVGAIEPAARADRWAVYQYHVDLSGRSLTVMHRNDSGGWEAL